MPRQPTNRLYKKGEPHRDAQLFIIVAEGEREDQYFSWFNGRNQRIRVQIVPRDGHASAPGHFLKRLNKFLEAAASKPDMNDTIWFVLDVDRWKRAQIDELIEVCKRTSNWNIAISNPCFEVWLNLKTGPLPDDVDDCDGLKTLLASRIRGGFHPNTICPLIEEGIIHAKAADTHPAHDFPDQMQTKVYRLATAMLDLLGNNWK